MYLKKSDIEKCFTQDLAREFSGCMSREFAYKHAVKFGGPIARIRQMNRVTGSTYISLENDDNDLLMLSHIRKDFKDITIRNLRCTETFHPELNLTVRKLNLYYSYYACDSEGTTLDSTCSIFEIYVSSNAEEYTELDKDTRLIVHETNDGVDSKYEPFWFLVRGHEIGIWVVKFNFLLSVMFDSEGARNWIQKNLKYGFLANEEIFLELEKTIPEKLLNRYYECKKSADQSESVLNKNNALYNFWYEKKDGKIRVGDWKVTKSEHNEKKKTAKYTFSNGHATISSVMTDSIRWMSVENDGEEGIICRIIHEFSKCSPEKNITINGINIPYTYTSTNYRMRIFGHLIKYAEEEQILHSLCCFHTEQEMSEFVEDCSKLSLKYRMILSEGVKTTAYLYRRGDTRKELLVNSISGYLEDPFDVMCEEEWKYQSGLSYEDEATYSRCVLSPVRFQFQRREKGRGLDLVLTDGTSYKVKPKCLLAKTCNHGRTFKFLRKALGKNVTSAQIRAIVEDAASYFEQAKKASEALLKSVMEELGAKKINVNIQKYQKTDAYSIIGKSKTEYAVIDEGPKYPIYRKTADGSWRFVCIESNSDISQEVGKDGIVTRLYALINDTDNTDDIYTLKGIADREEAPEVAS